MSAKLVLLMQQVLVYPLIIKLNRICDFYNLRNLFFLKYSEFIENSRKLGLDFLPVGTYEWDIWRIKISNNFSKRLPLHFLHHPLIGKTMVYGSTKFQEEKLAKIESMYDSSYIKKLLKESIIGLPVITHIKYKSSANTIHQVYHMSSYLKKTGKNLFESNYVVEWGGGYGCLARIFAVINPNCTYTILDLPELNALQYVYLSSIFGKSKVNFIVDPINIEKGKINLLASDYYIASKAEIHTETFISNWALTESGEDYQNFVKDKSFFSAQNVLVSCIDDENNFIINTDHPFYDHKVPIKVLGSENYYLVK
jgi:putative sugar O-methyltransferase